MVHERDEKYEGQEDGEYHFSDDQANYEMETDEVAHTVAEKPAAIVATTTKGGIDFSQSSGAIATPAQKIASTKPALAQIEPAKQNSAFQPLAQPLGMSGATPAGVAAPRPIVSAPPASVPISAPVEPVVVPPQQEAAPVAQPEQPAPAVIVQQTAMYNPAHPSADTGNNSMVAEPAEIAVLNQKIATLVQQNVKMQADYSQKISDYEGQNTALQGKLQDLNMRLASLETTIAHLGRSIQQETRPTTMGGASYRPAGSAASPAQAMMQSTEPKAAYTVQAIIPGRAWLKSEGGDTVTVAEGDTLKGYGRIVKIDPYDGLVELDIGGKIVALSYGATGE